MKLNTKLNSEVVNGIKLIIALIIHKREREKKKERQRERERALKDYQISINTLRPWHSVLFWHPRPTPAQ